MEDVWGNDTIKLLLNLKDAWTQEHQRFASAGHSACFAGRHRSATEVDLSKNSGDSHLVKAGQDQIPHHIPEPGALLLRSGQKTLVRLRTK